MLKYCHARGGEHPRLGATTLFTAAWIPAYAGMTVFWGKIWGAKTPHHNFIVTPAEAGV